MSLLDGIGGGRLLLAVIGTAMIIRVAYQYTTIRRHLGSEVDPLQKRRKVVLRAFMLFLLALAAGLGTWFLNGPLWAVVILLGLGLIAGVTMIVGVSWLFYRE